MVPYLSATLAVDRPNLAGAVRLTFESRTVCLETSEDIVRVGLVAAAVHKVTCLSKGVRLVQLVTSAVKIGNTHSDGYTLALYPLIPRPLRMERLPTGAG